MNNYEKQLKQDNAKDSLCVYLFKDTDQREFKSIESRLKLVERRSPA